MRKKKKLILIAVLILLGFWLFRTQTLMNVAKLDMETANIGTIIVMDEGRLVETGTYEELVALNGKFAELDRLCRIREREMSEV